MKTEKEIREYLNTVVNSMKDCELLAITSEENDKKNYHERHMILERIRDTLSWVLDEYPTFVVVRYRES